jgi:hypothetical protein
LQFQKAGNQVAEAVLSDPEYEFNMLAFKDAWEKDYCVVSRKGLNSEY